MGIKCVTVPVWSMGVEVRHTRVTRAFVLVDLLTTAAVLLELLP